jgi:A/G-specific adenine glycosylase
VKNFSTLLLEFYRDAARDLPWRNTSNPYQIWLSEVILQQTRVNQGLSYFNNFNTVYPSVLHLADASEDDLMRMWQGLGYYSRARNMHSTAKFIRDELNGKFPETFAGLKKLKGIGDYTAAAIASFAYREKVPVVDGNVYRFLSRLFAIDMPIPSDKARKYFSELALNLMDTQRPDIFNQAIMEFGALICTPAAPRCHQCPFSENCLAYQSGSVNKFPVKQAKKPKTNRYLTYWIIGDKLNIRIQKRTQKDIWKNLYEFPLTETPAEPERQELIQCLEKIMNIDSKYLNFQILGKTKHILSHQNIHLQFCKVETLGYEACEEAGTYLYVNSDSASKLGFPIPLARFLDSYFRS